MFRSATFKLTMWYLALVVAISLAFSLILYHVATTELVRGLHHQTQQIFNNFPVFLNSPMLRTGPTIVNEDHRILFRLIGFNLIVIVLAGFASYWLARRTLQPIEDAHEQQKRFTADVSHELRTPLTAIKMESEVALLGSDTTAHEFRQTIASNLEEVAKLETLINNLLRLTRLEASELQQNFTALQAHDVATEAVHEISKLAQARNITIENKTKDESFSGDRDSLVQLLVILLDNAIKYSPKDSTVSITCNETKEQVIFAVKDHGIGIERQALERVFDRFYRADTSRTKAETSEGFGLGLSIAKMIVDVHHGTIVLTSKLDHGTTATISLPKAML
jgi:two-component system sensor histidine kinase CiaH